MKKFTLLFSLLLLTLTATLSAGTKSRVFIETNLTPVFGYNVNYNANIPISTTNPMWVQNPVIHDQAMSAGYDQYTMIYNGTLNLVDTWSGHSALEVANGQVIWGNSKDNCTPINIDAVLKVSALHKTNPYHYATPALNTAGIAQASNQVAGNNKLLVPICFDLESLPNINFSADDGQADQVIKVKNITKTISAARSYAGGGPDTELWWYGFPGTPGTAINDDNADQIEQWYYNQKPIANMVSAACCSFYNWDVPVVNPTTWYGQVKAADSIIVKYYPHLAKNKIAFVCPFKQMYWPANAPLQFRNQNNMALETKVWSAQIDYLVENDWDIVWWSGSADCTPVQWHLNYLASKRRITQ